MLEELHLRRNEVDKIQKSFRDEAQKKQKEFEEKIKALREVREDASKIINKQRKSIKQLQEKNKALKEVRDAISKEMEEAHQLWVNSNQSSNPGTKLTRHVQIDVKEAKRLKDKLKSDNSK